MIMNAGRIMAAALLFGTWGGTISHAATVPPPHVFMIMMENLGTDHLLGNSNAPYSNSLIGRYGFASRYYAITHPSLPNYMALIAGDDFGINDGQTALLHTSTLVDAMERKHLTWKAYMESLPHPGFTDVAAPTPIGPYARKHDPFMLIENIVNNPARRNRVVPASQLTPDLKSGHVPNLSFISPDLCHDMHGISGEGSPCPGDHATWMRSGDTYLSHLVPRIMHSPAWTSRSIIFIVWDESDSSNESCCGFSRGGGRVPAIVIAPGMRHHTSKVPYNHYSLLRTLQSIWKLPCLRQTCKSTVHPMTEFLPGSGRS